MANEPVFVFGGVDTHRDIHVAAIVDAQGRILETAAFEATSAGYVEILEWMRSFGELVKVGVEGTGAYGAGLARHLRAKGVEVVEVNRPNRQMRRRRGKSDTVDAEAAARATLNGEATVVPKDRDSHVESIRVLRIAFCSARNSRTRVALQIRDLIVTAPPELREGLSELSTAKRVERCAGFRPRDSRDSTEATKLALRTLARRFQALSGEMAELTGILDTLTQETNPALRAAKGVGPDVAAILLVAAGDNPERLRSESAFAAMCGVSPVQASSGKTIRHRLNRSGNRQANHALWRIVMVRLTCDEETKAYAARRMAEGKTKRDVIRCLKRYIAREVFALLTKPNDAHQTEHPGPALRRDRIAAGFAQHHVATALGANQSRISEIENARRANSVLATRYRTWLDEHPTCAA